MASYPDTDPKARFTSRAADYLRYRPHYPDAILEPLRKECRLTPQSLVADVACGTGLLAEAFLRNGNPVIGIEPNAAMRESGAEYLRQWPLFRSVDASAENTSLPAASMHFIVVGQALHWLDHARSRLEFARVLCPDGWVVLVWNSRISSGHSFSGAYHQLLCRYCGENSASPRRTSDRQIEEFLAPYPVRRAVFPNVQKLDWNGIRGRLLSSSYVPAAGQPLHDEIIASLRDIYRQHETNNAVELNYNTEVFYGQFH